MPATVFQVLIEHLALTMPPAIRVLPRGFEPHERRAEIDNAWATSRRLKLVDGRDRVDDRLVDLLHVLSRPQRAVEGTFHVSGQADTLLACTTSRGALAVKNGETITVTTAHPTGLGEQSAALLPSTQPGWGRSVSIRSSILRKAGETSRGENRAFEQELRRLGVAAADAHIVAAMNRNPDNGAQFAVTLTDRLGRHHRADHVIGWWTNNTGSYLVEEHPSSTGEVWTTVAPTDNLRIAQQINKLLDTLERQRT